MRILLAGGGTGGAAIPVLAVSQEIKKLHPHTEFLFIGSRKGPERMIVEEAGIKFKTIPTAKLRRYISLANLFIPIKLTAAFLKSLKIVRNFEPDVFFSAGGFVAVPLALACYIKGVKIVIHQQDVRIGLANKIIAPLASTITTAFEQTSKEFYSGSGLFNKKWRVATWVGNPIRPDLFESAVDVKKYFNLHDQLPILLVLGGSTGAAQINNLIRHLLPDLVLAHQVIHQTGVGKNNIDFKHPNYHPIEFIPYKENAAILKLAHLVISRAGLSMIAELSALKKSAIVIPMPNTHQEENAKMLLDTHSAVVLSGNEVSPENLKQVINSLKFNQKRVEMLQKNISELMPKDAASKLAKIIISNELK
jgi:UDP-N-acetylglucosamine--N-acetylmuramyl-(pentapeptide) pyrophosphoryl-undecaprenol N-acetylglucosamine transferase